MTEQIDVYTVLYLDKDGLIEVFETFAANDEGFQESQDRFKELLDDKDLDNEAALLSEYHSDCRGTMYWMSSR